MPLLLIPIVILLAASGPLVIGVAYGHHRVAGSLAGAAWILFAAFFAGLNGDVGALLAVTYPLQTIAVFGALAAALYAVGPKSALWVWVAKARPVRALSRAIYGMLERNYGVSKRGAGELVAAVLALAILAPVAVHTVKPHPVYAYALDWLEAELTSRIPDPAKLADAEWRRVLTEAMEDGTAIGQRIVVDARKDLLLAVEQSRQRVARAYNPERRTFGRWEIDKIEQETLLYFDFNIKKAAEEATIEATRRALDADRGTIEQASREAMLAVKRVALRRAPEKFDHASMNDLRTRFRELRDETVAEMSKVGSEVMAAEVIRIVNAAQPMIVEAAKHAARTHAAKIVKDAVETMKKSE